MDLALLYVDFAPEIEAYAINLIQKNGLDTKDALHVACAIKSKCDIFLTTDKKLIRKTGKIDEMRVINPIHLITDEMEQNNDKKWCGHQVRRFYGLIW